MWPPPRPAWGRGLRQPPRRHTPATTRRWPFPQRPATGQRRPCRAAHGGGVSWGPRGRACAAPAPPRAPHVRGQAGRRVPRVPHLQPCWSRGRACGPCSKAAGCASPSPPAACMHLRRQAAAAAGGVIPMACNQPTNQPTTDELLPSLCACPPGLRHLSPRLSPALGPGPWRTHLAGVLSASIRGGPRCCAAASGARARGV